MTVAAPSYSIMTSSSLSKEQIVSPVDLRTTYYCGNIIYNANATTLVLNDVGYSLIDSLKVASYHYNLKDHLGNVRVVLNEKDSIEQVNHYYSYGGLMGCSTSPSIQPYKFNGKEFDTTNSTNLYDYGARLYNPSTCIFTTADPLAEKYYSTTSYAYCLNNPVRYIDPDGREVYIQHGIGFLGLKNEKVKYENGILYNKDGSVYTRKVNGYLKKAVNALNQLRAIEEGASIVTELQSSSNVFTIKSAAKNQFDPDSQYRAEGNLPEIQKLTGNTSGSTGSGGTILWDSFDTNGGLDTSGGTDRPTFIGLGHEMAHASDSNKGLLYYSKDDEMYNYIAEDRGVLKSEWRAVYRENLMREQANIPLREYYGINMNNNVPEPSGARLLDATNQPINYPIK